MSELDEAIRARLQAVRVHMGEHRNAQFDDGVDPLFNDAGELGAAVQAVLDLHVPLDVHDLDAAGEPPPVLARVCRDCCDTEFLAAYDYGDRVSVADGEPWPCATVSAIASSLGVSGEDRSEPAPAPAEWVFGFGPKGAESAWRCQRCREVMRKNQRACPACAYTVFDPVHREVVSPEGTS